MATEFHCFNKLPKELRDIVYEYLVQLYGDFHVCVRPRYAKNGSLELFEFHNEESYGKFNNSSNSDYFHQSANREE